MSDVLTINTSKRIMLITGLANLQTIRTCEMSEIKVILFVRGKNVSEEMLELAQENEMVLIETPLSMYRTSGILFNLGLSPVY
jgi:serine kinase of HPr protein (carbohydrate metabolism regulator)